MKQSVLADHTIDYVEIYTPMAKALAYWHTEALGFTAVACSDLESGRAGISSYVMESGDATVVLSSTYPIGAERGDAEIAAFVRANYCGVKRVALRVPSVKQAFERSISGGAIPVKFPTRLEDETGFIEEAAVKFYDHSEIVFSNRESYNGAWKPGYRRLKRPPGAGKVRLQAIDHIAGEVRINESGYWTNYLTQAIGTRMVQSIGTGEDNKTGMLLNINQSPDKKLTLVIAEPENYMSKSKVQKNIETFGPGIHHLAFATDDMVATTRAFREKNVEFVRFPDSYYALLRDNPDLRGIDLDSLQEEGILIDKEQDTYLLQKFIKPISDRPFFLYEIVQRVNGYCGFALNNINVLKRAEEMEIQKV